MKIIFFVQVLFSVKITDFQVTLFPKVDTKFYEILQCLSHEFEETKMVFFMEAVPLCDNIEFSIYTSIQNNNPKYYVTTN
jgi:hypothetical protein